MPEHNDLIDQNQDFPHLTNQRPVWQDSAQFAENSQKQRPALPSAEHFRFFFN